jgi:hypothetical protein
MSKKIKTWSDDIKVGIYDDQWALTLYDDKAILHMPYVKWVNNSGSLAESVTRFDAESGAKTLAQFHKIAAQEIEDGEDYTERIQELVWDIN